MLRIGLGVLLGLVMAGARADYILSSPARVARDQETAIYRPVAELLARVTGEKIVYRHPGSYLLYQQAMRRDRYDIVFDGPAFIDWRVQRLGHRVVARLDGELTFVVLTRHDDARLRSLAPLVGRNVCSFPPPHLTALTLLSEYEGARIPRLQLGESFAEIYDGIVSRRCEAGVLPLGQYQKLDSARRALRPVFISAALPNQAFTVSRRLAKHADAIGAALADPANAAALRPLLEAFKAGAVVRAGPEDYRGLARMIKGEWGYD